MSLFDKLNAAKQEKLQATLKEGEDFLAANKVNDGVVCTETGLQYLVLQEGNGPKPNATDKVKCHYHGTVIDGRHTSPVPAAL